MIQAGWQILDPQRIKIESVRACCRIHTCHAYHTYARDVPFVAAHKQMGLPEYLECAEQVDGGGAASQRILVNRIPVPPACVGEGE